MSMLTNPPHVVIVQNREPVITSHGTVYQPVGDPIEVPCTVRAVSATEDRSDGLSVTTLRRIMAADWPGTVRALITWGGQEWDAEGDPELFDGSGMTRHWEIRMRRTDGSGV